MFTANGTYLKRSSSVAKVSLRASNFVPKDSSVAPRGGKFRLFFAPRIVETITEGRQPVDLTVETITRRLALASLWSA